MIQAYTHPCTDNIFHDIHNIRADTAPGAAPASLLREYLSPAREYLSALTETQFSNALEFRFRTNRPVTVEIADTVHRLRCNTRIHRVVLNYAVTPALINSLLQKFCDYSLYAFEQQLARGFITLRGGCRVGIAGTAVYDEFGGVAGIKDVSGLNLRVAREFIGCADGLYNLLRSDTADGAGIGGVIIAGKPMTAKTTLLRDLCRLISSEHKVVVIDTRGEIAAAYGGVSMLNVGSNTDVLTGFEKADGAARAIRTLSPEYVAFDEVDLAAPASACDVPLTSFRGRGVKLIMTCHTDSITDGRMLREMPLLRQFAECGITYAAAVSGLGNVDAVYKIG